MTAVVLVFVRYGFLWAARGIGWLRRTCCGGARRLILGLLLAWGVAWLLTHPGPVPTSWFTLTNVVGLFLVVAVGRWVAVSRRRMVIGSFVDYRGENTGEKVQTLPGLSTLLQAELARLYDVLDVVDGRRAAPDVVKGPQNVSFDEQRSLEQADKDVNQITPQPLDVPAPIMAEDLSGVLDAAISVEATMSLGPVKLPIGALANLVSRLAQGPRLTGSVHSTDGGVVVTARTVGAVRARTWKVDGTEASNVTPGAQKACPEDLLEELAIRVFTDLALQGLVRWKATRTYVEGLRAYRECLRTKKDRRLNLERAKDHFIETIARDNSFDLAHYNLGVVATELKQREAAEQAFLRAIAINRERWAPYYGLAQLYFVEGRYPEVLPLCGRIVRIRQHRAEAYHLRALTNRRIPDPPASMRDRRRALRWAWVRLCGAALRGCEHDARRLAATSLRNLAGVRAYQAKQRWPATPKPGGEDDERRPIPLRLGYLAACCELRQGRSLDRSDAEMHFELGKLYAARRKWKPAARHLERAVEIVPDRPRFWIQLARAYAGPYPKRQSEALQRKALTASERACAQPSLIVESGFARLHSVYTRIGACDEARRVSRLARFELQRRGWGPDVPPNEELEALLASADEHELWETTQVCVQLGHRYLSTAGGEQACAVARTLAGSLERLCDQHPREVLHHGIYVLVAEVLGAAGEKTEALRYAETAVAHDPLSGWARKVLAGLYLDLNHLEQAREAWSTALVSDPDGPDTNLGMGQCLVRTALESHDPGRRGALLREAVGHLRTALRLHQLGGFSHSDSVDPHVQVHEGEIRFWLARAHFELDDYEQAVTQYHVCLTLGFQPGLSALRLGVSHLRLGQVWAGERVLEDILARSGESRAQSDGQGQPTPRQRPYLTLPGDELAPGDVEVWARINLAGSMIDRDAGVDEALESIRAVRVEAEGRPHGPQRNGILAACADWQGWADAKAGNAASAIRWLNHSVKLQPTAEAYAHLARVYADCALGATDRVDQQRDAARAQQYATLARRMGLGTQQAAPLDDVLRRLQVERRASAVEESAAEASNAR